MKSPIFENKNKCLFNKPLHTTLFQSTTQEKSLSSLSQPSYDKTSQTMPSKVYCIEIYAPSSERSEIIHAIFTGNSEFLATIRFTIYPREQSKIIKDFSRATRCVDKPFIEIHKLFFSVASLHLQLPTITQAISAFYHLHRTMATDKNFRYFIQEISSRHFIDVVNLAKLQPTQQLLDFTSSTSA